MSEIRETIIQKLGLPKNSANKDILSALKKALRKYHPDHAQGKTEAELNETNFEIFEDLYHKFKKECLTPQNTTTDITRVDPGKDSIAIAKEEDEINHLIDEKTIYDEKDRLATHITFLESKVKILEDENQSLKERLSAKRRKDNDKSKEEIRKHFNVKPLGKGISIFSIIALISMFFKTVRTSLNDALGINNNAIGVTFVILLIVVLFFYWIFKYCQRSKIDDLIDKPNNPKWMELNVDIKEARSDRSIKYYVSQSDIYFAVLREIKNGYSRYLFPFKQNTIIDLIANHIISYYLDAEVMEIGDSDVFDRHFNIYRSDDNLDELSLEF